VSFAKLRTCELTLRTLELPSAVSGDASRCAEGGAIVSFTPSVSWGKVEGTPGACEAGGRIEADAACDDGTEAVNAGTDASTVAAALRVAAMLNLTLKRGKNSRAVVAGGFIPV
jgi:hypothetical protein